MDMLMGETHRMEMLTGKFKGARMHMLQANTSRTRDTGALPHAYDTGA